MDELAAGTKAGRYTIVRCLGAGQFGSVYEALSPYGARVALKRLHRPKGMSRAGYEEILARFDREAAVCRSLASPHIVPVYDHAVDPTVGPILTMRLLRGKNLDARLETRAPLSPSVAVGVALQICAALAVAHAQGVVHRDLKPENVFLDATGDGELTVVVCDFGLAKICDEAGSLAKAGLTATGVMMGTPYYMSPEQLLDAKRVDARCDVWAVGAVLYHALAGRPAFEDTKSFAEFMAALSRVAIPPLEEIAPWVPKELAHAVGLMLKPIDTRLASIAAVEETLRSACAPPDRLRIAAFVGTG
jgi:serine/threonine-protein kinase